MYWLDNDSGVTTPPAIPAVVSSTRQYFTEGGGGDQPSIPGGEWFNMMTDELLAVLTAAGIAPDKADHTQLAAALAAMFPNKMQFSASLAVNGYQKLSSGLIIQWGISATVSAAAPSTIVTFPIAFPNGVLHISPSDKSNGFSYPKACVLWQMIDVTLAQFIAMNLGSINVTSSGDVPALVASGVASCPWFAIGY